MNLATIVANIKAKKHFHQPAHPKRRPIMGAGGLIWNPHQQKLLVVKGLKWSLPKGHLEIDPDELPHIGAEREIFEETSLQLTIPANWRSRKLRRYVYYIICLDNADDLQLTPLDQSEIKEIKWCDLQELQSLDCNKQLLYFVNHWSSMTETFREDRLKLTMTGRVPSPSECGVLQQQFLADRQLSREGHWHDPHPSSSSSDPDDES